MNSILNLSKKRIIVFGIGTNARILSYLFQQKGIEVISYLIGDDQTLSVSDFAGVPVCKLSMCSEELKSYPVVLTVRECVSLKVKKELMESGFCNIISVENYSEWVEILESFYRPYFEGKKVDVNARYLDLKGTRVINGFRLDIEGRYSFLAELGDIILPGFFDDYSICNEGPYELKEPEIKIKNEDVVLDCGANMGLFSVLALNRGGEVYCFEPAPHTRGYLEEYKNLYPDRMHIFPYALADKEGDTEFYVGSDLNGENSISNLSGTGKECIRVPVKTIDHFVKENGISRVDFIKADIEGAERHMLSGAKETMKKFAPKLAICTYHLKDDPKVLEEIIRQANPDYKIIHRYKKIYAYTEK